MFSKKKRSSGFTCWFLSVISMGPLSSSWALCSQQPSWSPWQGRRQLREIGGGGQNLNQRGTGFRRNPKAFSGRNHKFSAQKQVISKKKKDLRRNPRHFLAKITYFNVFLPKNINFFLLKKFRGGQEKNPGGGGQKWKSGGAWPPPLATCLAHGPRGHCPPAPPVSAALNGYENNYLLVIYCLK